MQYPIIDLIADAYLNNGWTGLDIPETITFEPIQLGSGEPSPDNIRPIEGTFIPSYGTVYGGTLDVTTGMLTVDMAEVDLGTLTWNRIDTQGTHWRFWSYLSSMVNDSKLISSQYAEINASVQYTGVEGIATQLISDVPSVMVSDERYSEVSEFKTAMDGVQLVYELATPITYQCTNEDIAHLLNKYSSSILKLPLPHYFPHPVIDALQRAAAGNQTAEDTEILRHYLTPLGIGGI